MADSNAYDDAGEFLDTYGMSNHDRFLKWAEKDTVKSIWLDTLVSKLSRLMRTIIMCFRGERGVDLVSRHNLIPTNFYHRCLLTA